MWLYGIEEWEHFVHIDVKAGWSLLPNFQSVRKALAMFLK